MSAPNNTPLMVLAGKSARGFFRLVGSGRLRLRKDRKWRAYEAADGHSYAVFRESVAKTSYIRPGCVLEVGFRLKFIRSSKVMHWLFQRLCILTTPFWSGFEGFVVKLWMVDRKSRAYLGIYQWSTPGKAQYYVDALERVLRAVSIPDSVWHKLYPSTDLDDFLNRRSIVVKGA